MTHLTTYNNPFTQIQSIFDDPFFLGFNNQFVRLNKIKKQQPHFPRTK